MPQVRKEEVRKRILKSADRLFERKGYIGTTLAAIARESGTSIGSIYVYFDSKVELFFALYGPWLRKKLDALDRSASKYKAPRKRLEHVMHAIWYDIPTARKGFTNNFIQAISAAKPEEFSYDLYRWCANKLTTILSEALPPERRGVLAGNMLADILIMAFDGYAINYKLGFPEQRVAEAAQVMTRILLGEPLPDRDLPAFFGFSEPLRPKSDRKRRKATSLA